MKSEYRKNDEYSYCKRQYLLVKSLPRFKFICTQISDSTKPDLSSSFRWDLLSPPLFCYTLYISFHFHLFSGFLNQFFRIWESSIIISLHTPYLSTMPAPKHEHRWPKLYICHSYYKSFWFFEIVVIGDTQLIRYHKYRGDGDKRGRKIMRYAIWPRIQLLYTTASEGKSTYLKCKTIAALKRSRWFRAGTLDEDGSSPASRWVVHS